MLFIGKKSIATDPAVTAAVPPRRLPAAKRLKREGRS
jgi:hypothetical protein